MTLSKMDLEWLITQIEKSTQVKNYLFYVNKLKSA